MKDRKSYEVIFDPTNGLKTSDTKGSAGSQKSYRGLRVRSGRVTPWGVEIPWLVWSIEKGECIKNEEFQGEVPAGLWSIEKGKCVAIEEDAGKDKKKGKAKGKKKKG